MADNFLPVHVQNSFKKLLGQKSIQYAHANTKLMG